MQSASRSGSQRLAFGEETRRNAEVIRALGLGKRMQDRWEALNTRHLTDQLGASDAAGGMGTVSKVLRLFLQSGILGLGAYLVIEGQVSAGTIIAASIIMSRALAPIETTISHWRGFVAARQSYRRLMDLFKSLGLKDAGSMVALPRPQASLAVQGVSVAPPGEQRPVIQGVSFTLAAGDGLGIIGPSGSGKSTLARALVGIWQPMWQQMRMGGSVRLDGATLDQWATDDFGRHIGYLPQDVALFAGTVAENIARFDAEATSEAILAAAKSAGVHDMIVQLPGRLSDRRRRRWHRPVRGPAPAHCPGARPLWRSLPGRARRAELQPRRGRRGGTDGGHPIGPGARRHRHRHRPSSRGPRSGRSGSRHGQRAGAGLRTQERSPSPGPPSGSAPASRIINTATSPANRSRACGRVRPQNRRR